MNTFLNSLFKRNWWDRRNKQHIKYLQSIVKDLKKGKIFIEDTFDNSPFKVHEAYGKDIFLDKNRVNTTIQFTLIKYIKE